MEHPFPFDPTYGYGRAELRQVPAPAGPPDFDEFWRSTYAETRRQPLALTVEELTSPSAEHRLRLVRFKTLGEIGVGAWLVTPRARAATAGVVIGHGYGSREQPDYLRRDVAALYPCAPGFSLSAAPGLPAAVDRHVVHGVDHRDTYLWRHCVASLWSAAWALAELEPGIRDRLVYFGGSFGGGLGALMLPWEPLYRRAYLEVPTFGNQPLRLTLPGVGSGEPLRQYVATHPAARDVLPYYDAATAARRIKIPVLVAPALFDPAVAPPGQFAVANALGGPHEIFPLTAGHFDYPTAPAERAELDRRLESFLWSDAPAWA